MIEEKNWRMGVPEMVHGTLVHRI
ncbi:MAG: hypothetical protein UT24_C0003G0001, partial [Candidatus Woesebacteria bacterium GW2011_GWB1_39_12]